jgi:hypothetical protein
MEVYVAVHVFELCRSRAYNSQTYKHATPRNVTTSTTMTGTFSYTFDTAAYKGTAIINTGLVAYLHCVVC